MPMLDHLAAGLLDRLVWTSLQALALFVLVALVGVFLPRLSAATRSALWWVVGLQVVLGLCWQVPIGLPLLSVAGHVVDTHTATASGSQMLAAFTQSAGTGYSAGGRAAPQFVLYPWLAAAWVLGLLAQLPSLISEHRRLMDLRRGAKPVFRASSLQRQCDTQARLLGLRRSPELLVSAAVTSPMVGGFRRPFILWPEAPIWVPSETRFVIAHELAHLKRRDLWLGFIPALAQRLFFFHPCVRMAAREYSVYREAACDAHVLKQYGVCPREYGQLLLRLGVVHKTAAGVVSVSLTFRNLKRRLLLLRRPLPAPSHFAAMCSWALVGMTAALGVVPYRVVAAANSTVPGNVIQVDRAAAAARSDDQSASLTVCCGRSEIDIGESSKQQGIVLFEDGNVFVNGSDADVAAAKSYYEKTATLLWFRRSGETYMVRDLSTIQRVKSLYGPAVSVAEQEARLATEQQEVAAEIGAGAERIAKLAGEQSRLADSLQGIRRPTQDQREPAAGAKRLDERQRELQGKELSITKSQALLQQRQAELTMQQALLDRRFAGISASLEQPLGRVLDQIIASGHAKRHSAR